TQAVAAGGKLLGLLKRIMHPESMAVHAVESGKMAGPACQAWAINIGAIAGRGQRLHAEVVDLHRKVAGGTGGNAGRDLLLAVKKPCAMGERTEMHVAGNGFPWFGHLPRRACSGRGKGCCGDKGRL